MKGRTSQLAAQRWREHADIVKRHVAEYERTARKLDDLRAKVAATEAELAVPLVELGKVVGRTQAAALVGVDVRAVNRAYRTARNGSAAGEPTQAPGIGGVACAASVGATTGSGLSTTAW